MKTSSLLLVVAACMVAWLAGTWARAADVPKPKNTPPKDTKDPAAPTVDPYALPETTDSTVIVEHCKAMLALRAKVRSQAELTAHTTKLRPAVKLACDKIIEIEKGDTTANGRYARRQLLGLEMGALMGTDPAKKTAVVDSVKKFLSSQEMTGEDIGVAMQTGQMLERTSPDQAKEFYTFAKKEIEKSKAPTVAAATKRIDASLRRMNLLGNEMELTGTTVDGKPFDVKSLKGKVVLVDFWATWCHFCIEEQPNVKKNYAGYHNKGFEVVAISADRTREPLDAFLAKDKLPWIQLWDEGGRNAAMEHYAVTGYPTVFLIGKSGKVISLAARGPKLTELLKAELGEPDPVPEDVAKDDAPKVPAKDKAAPLTK